MVSYETEAILINLFGDEIGIGEAWDLYQLLVHRKKIVKIIVIIIGVIFIALGICLLAIGGFLWEKDKNHIMVIVGGVFVLIGVGIIVLHHILSHHSIN
tara:strand:+ start:58 stop:354 length:297 start_codon:yes stop_codon:yes gene_type:complete